jgi:hypothetical protein
MRVRRVRASGGVLVVAAAIAAAWAASIPGEGLYPPAPTGVHENSSVRDLFGYFIGLLTASGDERNVVERYCTVASVSMALGDYDFAHALLADAGARVGDPSYGAAAGQESVFLDDSRAYFVGDIHERVMLFLYRGLLEFKYGRWNDARIAFQTALRWDSHAVEPEHREDIALLHRLLAHTFLLLDDPGNARVAVEKYNALVPEHSRVTFDAVASHNVIVVAELGLAPRKDEEATGPNRFVSVGYPEAAVRVAVDGGSAAAASPGLDLGYQAATRGRTRKDTIQTAKKVTTYLASAVPFGWLVTGISRSTDYAQSDVRSWGLLPDQLTVWSGWIAEGLHDLRLEYRNDQDRPIPRIARRLNGVVSPDPVSGGPALILVPSPSLLDSIIFPDSATAKGRKVSRQIRVTLAADVAETSAGVCFRGVDHIDGTRSVLLGGSCFCPPTEATLEAWRRAGDFAETSLDDIEGAFRTAGYRLPSDGHRACGNLCAAGPHVLSGGRCLVTPIPGTPSHRDTLRAVSARSSRPRQDGGLP